METGRKILNLRKDRGVPQKDLAAVTTVTAGALSRIESGDHEPRAKVALSIARHLGVTADYLLDVNAPYPPPARELLANLVRKDTEPRDQTAAVSHRELRILQAFRNLEEERRTLLESTLDAPRDRVRYTAFLLGAAERLPGIDPAELSEFRKRTRR